VHQRFSTVTASALSSLGLLVLQAPDEERSSQYVPLRHLLAWLMVFFLLINSIYSGGLASVLTVPRYVMYTMSFPVGGLCCLELDSKLHLLEIVLC
jgi:hypothetical protein